MKKYKVGLIGIGGFGVTHSNTILRFIHRGLLELVGFADPKVNADDENFQTLLSTGADYYKDYKKMLLNHPDLDFVVIASPIHLHKEMSIEALTRGINVLLEKPPAATIQDIDSIIEEKNRSGKICAVNFQKTTCKAFRLLIDKIKDGFLGDIESVAGVCIGTSTADRYIQKPWMGKLTCNGQYVLDGTINNPFAHVLNNSLIIAGCGNALKAVPMNVQAELYHGYSIESEDTSSVRIITENGVEIRFYATLCNRENLTQTIIVKGTKGKAVWRYNGTLDIIYNTTSEDQVKESYSLPTKVEELMDNIYYNFLEVLEDNTKPLFNSISACRSFVLCVNGAFESCPQPYSIPEKYTIKQENNGMQKTFIKDIYTILYSASENGKLLSEIPVDWAVKTPVISLKNYKAFNHYL
jgi:predicted dehydrogenase